MPKYLSNRSKAKLTPQSKLSADRYEYLTIENAEPNLGDPLVGPSSVGAKPVAAGQQYIIVTVEGKTGERYWIPNQGGIIPGAISVFEEDFLVGGASSTTQLNFKGNSVTATGIVGPPPGIGVTITIAPPGNNGSVLFKENGDFATSSGLLFNSSVGILTVGNGLVVGTGGTFLNVNTNGLIGIGTTNPTQELHIQGDLRLTGTIYDYNNQPGTNTQVLVKNNFGGVTWVNQGTIKAGAGGTYSNVQFHNNAGLVDGAPNFVFDEINSRVGIGSTQPKVLLDILGISSFKGGTFIDNLTITDVATVATLGVTGTTTTRNLLVTGVTTVGFLTGTNAYFTGIVTSSTGLVSGFISGTSLSISGISTLGVTSTTNLTAQQLNVSGISTLGVTSATNLSSRQLNVTGVSTFNSQVNINNLNVSGVGTFDNIKLDTNTISTLSGNLILDSNAGTTQVNDAIYVNDTTQSTSKDTGSIITEGGVGIEKDLYVGGTIFGNVNGNIIGYASSIAVSTDTTNTIRYIPFVDVTSGLTTSRTDTAFVWNPSSNSLGIGTTNPQRSLHIAGVGVSTGGIRLGNVDLFAFEFNQPAEFGGSPTFRNSVTNGNTVLRTIPNGSGSSQFEFFGNDYYSNQSSWNNFRISLDSSSSSEFRIDTASQSGQDAKNIVIETNVLGSTNRPNRNQLTLTTNGNIGIGTTSSPISKVSIGGTMTPSANNTHDLGSATNKWNNVYANNFVGAIIGNADTATYAVNAGITTNLKGGIASQIPYQTAANTTAFIPNGSSGQLLQSNGTSAPSWVNPTNLTVDKASYADNAGIATNLKGGATGSIPYQTAANTTTFLTDPNVNGRILTWNDTTNAPVWSDPTAISVGTASSLNITSDISATPRYLVLSSTTSGITTALVDSGITYTPSTDILSLTNLSVSGISTFAQKVNINSDLGVTGFTTTQNLQVYQSTNLNRLNATGIATVNALNINTTSIEEGDLGSNGGSDGIFGIYNTSVLSGRSISFNLKNNAGNYEIPLSLKYDLATINNLSVSGVSTFNGNVTLGNTNTDKVSFGATVDSNIIPSGTTRDLGSATNKWNNVYANTFIGIVDTATKLSTARNIAITGDLAWNVNFDGSANVSSTGTLSNTGVSAGTYGSSTQVPQISVDSKGRVTSASNISVNAGFSAGTLMLFQQTSAPTGWTKQTTHNDKALRVVSGSASSGGSTAFTSVFTSRTPSGSVSVSGSNSGGSVTGSVSGSNSGGSVTGSVTISNAAVTLTSSQIPSHSHTATGYPGYDRYNNFYGGFVSASGPNDPTYNTGSTGGGGSHTHANTASWSQGTFTNPTWSGSWSQGTFTNPTWSGSASFSGTALDFAVQYVDLIIASKN